MIDGEVKPVVEDIRYSAGIVNLAEAARLLAVPRELAAYEAVHLHMILHPGQATRQTLVEALHATLADVCTASSRSRPGVWRARLSGGRWILSEL